MMRGRNALIAILSILVVGGVAAGVYFYFIAPRMNNETPQQEELQHEEPEQTIECTDHTYGDWSTVTPASCTVAGKKERTCTLCGEKQEETLPALGHDLVGHAAQAATCMEIGWNAYDTCSRCDYTTYTEILALGHDVIAHIAQDPTCTEKGWSAYDTCSRCDYTTYTEISALGHDVIHHAAQETTCTEIGWEAYDTCSRCDYTTYEEIPALGHAIVHHAAQDPTCTDIGWEAYDTCSRCDYTTYEEIPALGHAIVHHAAQEATCTEKGWSAYDTCSRCDYTTYTEISALGHDVIPHAAQEATCTTIGWNAYDTCSRCYYTTYAEISALGHDIIPHSAQEPTCTEIGWEAYNTCSRCGYTTYEVIPATGHNYVERICSVCGEEESVLYMRVDINGEDDDAGEYLYFGTYPQSEVTDDAVKSALSAMAGVLPTSSNRRNWTSYGYYSDGSNSTDYMWYIDLEYNGEKYRGVYFTSYRPSFASDSSSNKNRYQYNNGYRTSTVYWFRYDPIKWRILSEENGEALILCEMIIDSQEYYPLKGSSSFSHNGGTGYANNYALSNIRKWLNETFYETAFTDLQKNLIQTTTVDNSARSTNLNCDPMWYNFGENMYACENTQDMVFLLSVQEATTVAYGFNNRDTNDDIVKQKKTTSYAQCQGAYTNTSDNYLGNGDWWLRSPNYNNVSTYTKIVNSGGAAYINAYVYNASNGVVPALKIQLQQ